MPILSSVKALYIAKRDVKYEENGFYAAVIVLIAAEAIHHASQVTLHDGWLEEGVYFGKVIYFENPEKIDLPKLLQKMYDSATFHKKLAKVLGEEGRSDDILGEIKVWFEDPDAP